MLISPLLLAALLPQDLTVSLTPRSGPATVVHQGAEYRLRVENNSDREVQSIVEVWVSPDISLRGVPGSLRLKKRQAIEFGCTIHVERDRPPGRVQLRVILREPGGKRLAHIKVPIRVAIGRDFLRLSFEGHPVGSVAGDAPHGGVFLRATANRDLLAPVDPSFDIHTFPYLTFWIRRGGGSASLNLLVGKQKDEVSLPLPRSRNWRRVVVDLRKELGDSANEVSAIGLRGHLDLDEFAVVRSPEPTVGDRLRGNHYAKTRVIALHEVVPGHHLQGVVHRLRPLSRFRRRFYSTVFGEGWALYCEETMHRHGFFDLETRFAQLQMRLWRAARVVVDVGLHTGDLTMAQAEKFMAEEVGLDPVNAKAEVLRYIDNPTRPMSYLVGFLMIDELEAAERRRLGDRFDGRVFRDRLLAFGAVPLPAVLKGFRR